ncbi:type II secretion system F family protein [Glutamicibacter ardleyensis]|uniref:type II secretion system F family protein n=1 Tax=Glutamicibacter ardleyensis TaxID=225894 RepID=UPI003FD5CE73
MTAVADKQTTKRKPLITFTMTRKADPETIARCLRALSLQLSMSTSEQTALSTIGEQYRKFDIGRKLTKASNDMVANGTTLSEVLSEVDVIPLISRKLIASSQSTSQLYANIKSASEMVSDAKTVKKRIVSALIPSLFNVGVTLAFMFFAVNVIVPKMITVFSNFHAETPTTTFVLLSVAESLKWVVATIFVASLVFMLWWTAFGRRSERFRTIMDRVLIKVPYIGEILVFSSTSRLFKNLALNLNAGMSETEALKSSASGCGNDALRDVCVKHTKAMFEMGAPFKGFVDSKLFPVSARQLVLASTTSYQAIELFEGLSPEFHQESKMMMDSFSKTLEPVVGIVTQLLLGVTILMVMFPMFQIYPALLNMNNGL